jgi:hypothetical protein
MSIEIIYQNVLLPDFPNLNVVFNRGLLTYIL